MRPMKWEEVYNGRHCNYRYDDETVPVVICGYDHDEPKTVRFYEEEPKHNPDPEVGGFNSEEKFDARFLIDAE